jgi:hypothetical protein
MKKAILFMSAVAMLAAISCNKAEVNEPQTETPSVNDAVESLEFVAYTEVETKTTLNGLSTEWVAGDNISVNGVNYITNESGSKVIFTKDNEDDIDPTAPYIAKYPWCMVDESGDMAFYSILDEEGKYEISSDCITDALAVAYSESEAILEFKNVMSLMKFQVPEEFTEEITEIRISTTEPLASNILVDYNNGKPTWRIEEGGTPSTEIILVTEGSFDPKATYYLPVLPGPKTNLTVRINGYLAATGKSITFERSRIHNVGTLPAPETSGWVIAGAYNNWKDDATAKKLYKDISGFVVKNFEPKGEFKLVSGGKWYSTMVPAAASKKWCLLKENQANMSRPTGTYDLWISADGKEICLVDAGASAPTISDANRQYYIVLQHNWSWNNRKLYSWNASNGNAALTGSWPGSAPKGTFNYDNMGYSYWEIPSSVYGKKLGIIFSHDNGLEQTQDKFIENYRDDKRYWLEWKDPDRIANEF